MSVLGGIDSVSGASVVVVNFGGLGGEVGSLGGDKAGGDTCLSSENTESLARSLGDRRARLRVVRGGLDRRVLHGGYE